MKNITEINASQFDTVVLKGENVVVDFYSTECPPCEALASKYESLAEIYGHDIKFIKIFRQENRDLAETLGVTGSPTVLFYQNGQQVGDRLTGGIKRADLERNLQALLPSDRVQDLTQQIKPTQTDCDVLILGGGPAGLTAAIYSAQAKLKTILVDTALPGGWVSTTHQVSNYPGFIEPVPGMMLAHYMSEQAKAAGAEFRAAIDVSSIDLHNKNVVIDNIETLTGKKLIIATGSSPRPLGIPGEIEYRGQGVSYCATCDAKYYQDRDVIVIGGGNSAIEEALYIARFASSTTIIHQFTNLQANKIAQDKAFANPSIKFMFEHEPRAFKKTESGMLVVAQNLKTGEEIPLPTDGIFVFVGMQPNLEGIPADLELDDYGYIKTDSQMRTSIPDVFAVGDVANKRYRQITTATSDGTVAAITVSSELES